MASKPPPGQELAPKEAGLFRAVVKFYEGKHYKKGIKAADQVLKKSPDHGETLAMKGLIVNMMNEDRKDEAFELVKRGLKHNLKSHVCWHVMGLLYRAHTEYGEAIKCYKNALRMDSDNQQVLRDLAGLQIQRRDIPGFVETKQQLLDLRPGNRNNWISFAVAHHLNDSHELAVQVLDAYDQTQKDEDALLSERYERGELLLYKAEVLREGRSFVKALKVLNDSQDSIPDALGAKELRARLMMDLDEPAQAQDIYRELVAQQPDNYRFHAALRAAQGLPSSSQAAVTPQQRGQLRELYARLQAEHPKCSAPFRIPLDFEEGSAFVAAAEGYVRRFLQKGIPSLFTDLKSLYADAAKAAALGQLFERLLAALSAEKAFPALAGQSEAEEASPQAELWTKVYLAQHHDRLGDTGRALELLGQCMEHTPTLVELYTFQAKVLKHAGDLQGAVAASDKARGMDLNDRFLNCMAAKAKFRAGDVEGAEATAAMFTKDGDQLDSLFDMQCMWYEIEGGLAWFRRRDYGRALKNLLAVAKHFAEIEEDQFDFHSYCIRKMTLRAYLALLRMEDGLYSAASFLKAAWATVEVYVHLANNPATSGEESDKIAAMSPEERKKFKQRQKKEAARQKKDDDAKAAAQEAATAEAGGKDKTAKKPAAKKKEDPDPEGKQLAATSDPLGEATKLLDKLKQHAASRIETQRWAFEVYLRKGRLLLALSAVQRALAIAGAADPTAHCLVVRFALAAQQAQQQPSSQAAPQVVQQVLTGQLAAILGDGTLATYQARYLQRHSTVSLLHLAAAAEAGALLDPSQAAASAQLILEGTRSPPFAMRHADCLAVRELLAGPLQQPAVAETWTRQCAQKFQWSAAFGGAKQVEPQAPNAAAAVAGEEHSAAALTNGVKDLKIEEK